MTNSANPDQLASESTLFAKTGHVVLRKRRVKSLFPRWNFLLQWYRPTRLLTLNTKISRRHTGIFFLIFPWQQDFIFHANNLERRNFAWNIKSCFQGKKKKEKYHQIVVPYAELAKRVVKVKSHHYENMPIQIYWKFLHQKLKVFR